MAAASQPSLLFFYERQHWPNMLIFLILYQRILGKQLKGNENHWSSAFLLNSSAGFLAGQSYFHSANAFFQCDPCPGLSPLQDVKHGNHTCPSAITEAGERLNQSLFPRAVRRGALRIEDYRGLPWRLGTFTQGREWLLILFIEAPCSSERIVLCDHMHGLSLAAPFTSCGGGTQHKNALQSKRKLRAQLSNPISF